jgi:hypothetical protein
MFKPVQCRNRVVELLKSVGLKAIHLNSYPTIVLAASGNGSPSLRRSLSARNFDSG